MMVPPAAAQAQTTITEKELSRYNSQISQVLILFLDTYGDPELFETVAESRLYSDIRDDDKVVAQLQETYKTGNANQKHKIRQLFSESVALLTRKVPTYHVPEDQLLALGKQLDSGFIDTSIPAPIAGIPTNLPMG